MHRLREQFLRIPATFRSSMRTAPEDRHLYTRSVLQLQRAQWGQLDVLAFHQHRAGEPEAGRGWLARLETGIPGSLFEEVVEGPIQVSQGFLATALRHAVKPAEFGL